MTVANRETITTSNIQYHHRQQYSQVLEPLLCVSTGSAPLPANQQPAAINRQPASKRLPPPANRQRPSSAVRQPASASRQTQQHQRVRPASYTESYTFSNDALIRALYDDEPVNVTKNGKIPVKQCLNFSLDAFASKWNSKGKRYCSLNNENSAWRTNFFSVSKRDVVGDHIWCNLLWADIPRVCQWLKRATHLQEFAMILLTPLWPNAQWRRWYSHASGRL